MDGTVISAMRTGAVVGVGAKYLARPDSASVGILGCGVQGRTNLLALKELFPLTIVHAYDIAPERAANRAARSLVCMPPCPSVPPPPAIASSLGSPACAWAISAAAGSARGSDS